MMTKCSVRVGEYSRTIPFGSSVRIVLEYSRLGGGLRPRKPYKILEKKTDFEKNTLKSVKWFTKIEVQVGAGFQIDT